MSDTLLRARVLLRTVRDAFELRNADKLPKWWPPTPVEPYVSVVAWACFDRTDEETSSDAPRTMALPYLTELTLANGQLVLTFAGRLEHGTGRITEAVYVNGPLLRRLTLDQPSHLTAGDTFYVTFIGHILLDEQPVETSQSLAPVVPFVGWNN